MTKSASLTSVLGTERVLDLILKGILELTEAVKQLEQVYSSLAGKQLEMKRGLEDMKMTKIPLLADLLVKQQENKLTKAILRGQVRGGDVRDFIIRKWRVLKSENE